MKRKNDGLGFFRGAAAALLIESAIVVVAVLTYLALR